MKNLSLILVLASALISCQSTSIDKKEDEIKFKEVVVLNDVPRSTLTFFEITDSRCPQGVNCVWAGNATVDLALDGVGTEGKISKHVNLCLGDCRGGNSQSSFRVIDSLDQSFAGQQYRFILKSVSTFAKTDTTKKKQDYSISLQIKKIKQ
ncbi:hypothetical protein [Dyadobacter psychrotolerans]|uniref:Lipoprotein n=1 Tax=Dyadobacter psychrotolerans TaxID=2541721 RepID=A0A4R5DVT4_9BACT|nr:hypothetical protein [Dyadobacter psychrotolerans]TDE18579.1 hypothetical protein E0F88_03305 [Dyadobacter psychrotolerans]